MTRARASTAQRLLRPLLVANPYAPKLTFMDDKTRTRRDHTKYLALIRTVTLLHQHQREMKTVEHDGKQVQYIEVTLDDIEAASRIAHEVLGHSLDELPTHTRKMLAALQGMASASGGGDGPAFRFTRRQVREAMGLGDTQVWTHLRRLVEMEYVLPHRTARGLEYELLYGGQGHDGRPFLPGLVDVEALRSGAIRGGFGGNSGGIRPGARRTARKPASSVAIIEVAPRAREVRR